MNIQWINSGAQLALVIAGKIINITNEHENFKTILKALKENKHSKVPALLNPVVKVKGITIKDGLAYFDGRKLDGSLAGRIISMYKERKPIQYLVNFLNRLELNPSIDSRNDLYEFLEKNNISITADGHFLAYKVVTEDFKDVRTKTYDNSVGAKPRMKREDVNPNRDDVCSTGLHVCAPGYIGEFRGQNVVQTKVDPLDVVTVPTDYRAQKMRTCGYEVTKKIGSWDEVKGKETNSPTVEPLTRAELLKALIDPKGKNRKLMMKTATSRLQKLYDKAYSQV